MQACSWRALRLPDPFSCALVNEPAASFVLGRSQEDASIRPHLGDLQSMTLSGGINDGRSSGAREEQQTDPYNHSCLE